MNVAAIGTALQKMDLNNLRELNRLVVEQIRERHREVDRKAAAKFKVGDLVEFTSDKHHRRVRIRIERINAVSLSGREIDGAKMPWRVSAHLCRLVGA